MFGSIQRDATYITELLAFIRREYGLEPVGITPAKRGYYGETWKLDTADHSYFVKLDYSSAHQKIYEGSFPIMEHLHDHGIDFISRIVKSAGRELSKKYDGAVLGIFDWIDGENIETDDTKIPEFQMLAKVYTIPADGVSIPREDFSGNSADKFFQQWKMIEDERIRKLFEQNRSKLEHRAARLKSFAAICRNDMSNFHITHGDAGGNLIESGDRYYIVDWDDPILAPPERDAWNMLCYRGWAGCIFHKAMRENGISYSMRPERLAYYCYYYFFYYLTEYLDGFTQLGMTQGLEQYFHDWTENRASYADRNF